VDPVVDLAESAEALPLARNLAQLIRQNVASHADKRALFQSLRGAVAILDDDVGTALTLRFDYGRLIIHGTVVGVPDLTVRGTAPAIRGLADIPCLTLKGLTFGLFDRGARAALSLAARSIKEGSLKVYGFSLHPRLGVKLLRILSRGG
jgi:hypothetical protein